jgi:ubiquinone/menaquinone biosynthesis C-methylase UbiE
MGYNPHIYWQWRSGTWKRAKREDEHRNTVGFVSKFLTEKGIILDCGSGDGQIFLHLREELGDKLDGRYVMCDIADGMREKCLEKTGILPLKWDGKTLPFEDNEFDLVLSISVMLHVPPQDIEDFVAEHARVCGKHMFVATWWDGTDNKKAGGHCFQHDYYSIFEKCGLKIWSERKTMRRGKKYKRRNWILKAL